MITREAMAEYKSYANIQLLNTLMARIKLARDMKDGGFRTEWWSSLNEYPIFYSLIAIYNIDNVIECGTNAGASALCFASGLVNCKKEGKVYTWDIEKINGIDEGTNMEHRVVRHLESFSEAKIPNVVGKRLIFIDGDHSYETCLADLRHIEVFARKGDVVLIHDIVKHGPVKDATVDFLKDKDKIYKEIPTSCGIGIIEW